MTNIQAAINELHVAFKKLNDAFFKGELPEPAITIQTSGNRKSMGWCTTKEVWRDKEGKNRRYELNIAAEYLDIEFMETMDTMLHEMVHLYNAIRDIQDCSRNGTYHNKRFKAECERRGFYFPDNKPDKKYGWAFPKLTEDSKKKIESLKINPKAFSIARKGFHGGTGDNASGEQQQDEKKPRKYKWICPACNLRVLSSKKEIAVKCVECDEILINEP
ncbi:SprT-like domain-containing protein [Bacillus sp. TE9122W]